MADSHSDTCVLVVEDETELRTMYREWLAESFEVRTAGDGSEALQTFDADVDVVLLDRNLPNTTGEKLLPHFRNYGTECEIALVTAVEPDWDILEMDFDAYVTKPVRQPNLLDLVDALCDDDARSVLDDENLDVIP